ncbi:MAG TPA: hypothetical protein VG604_01390 [Candidatus Saccharimonadales bacterium]|nr:hypothetical protein [Candidatus Saccharimonadales bacterium]
MKQVTSQINPRETKAIGWYAVQWVHVTDWFKAYSDRLRHGHRQPPAVPTLQQPPVTQPVTLEANTIAAADTSKPTKTKAERKAEAKANEYDKLKTVAKESQGLLAKVETIFPLTLFPDTLIIDRHKLAITYRNFFKVAQEVSVPIETIKNIQADMGPFFGSVTITSDNFINNTQTVGFLKRSDIKLVQKILQGAMVAVKENIDISKVETPQLKKQLMLLGEAHHT